MPVDKDVVPDQRPAFREVVVSGGTGMLGRALTAQFTAQGTHVTLLVNPASKRLAGLDANPLVSVLPCDIANMAQLEVPAGHTYDAFYHMAWGGTFGDARNNMHAQAANVDHAIDAVELAARMGCGVFVGAGSQAEYGRVEGSLFPDTPTNPENGYGIAKLAAGRMTRIRAQQLRMRHQWVRILSVYGPYDGARTMVMSSINALLDGQVPRFTPCEQLWDYLYCDDAARALLLVGQRGHDGAVYCIGSGQARPLREYVTLLRDAVDPSAALDIGALPYNDRQVMHLCANIDALTAHTGFTPQVPFEEGIARTVAWARRQRELQ